MKAYMPKRKLSPENVSTTSIYRYSPFVWKICVKKKESTRCDRKKREKKMHFIRNEWQRKHKQSILEGIHLRNLPSTSIQQKFVKVKYWRRIAINMHTTGPTCVTICSFIFFLFYRKKKRKRKMGYFFVSSVIKIQRTCKLSAKIHKKLDIM